MVSTVNYALIEWKKAQKNAIKVNLSLQIAGNLYNFAPNASSFS